MTPRTARREKAQEVNPQENSLEEVLPIREWRDKWLADPDHPVIAALASAVAGRFEKFLTWSRLSIGSQEWREGLQETLRILTELGELLLWLPELPGVPSSKAERKKIVGNLMSEAGTSWSATNEVVKAGFGRPGAPATARSRAVAALEMKIAGKTWLQVAQALCPLNHSHTRQCSEPIRRETARLENLLRKYELSVRTP